jgi:FAD synthase
MASSGGGSHGLLLARGHFLNRCCHYYRCGGGGGSGGGGRKGAPSRAFSGKSTSSSSASSSALSRDDDDDDDDDDSDGIERIRNVRESAEIIVALGKFDAMHRGHKALAVAAATLREKDVDDDDNSTSQMKQQAVLLSFENMAEVLGWKPRKPVTAKRDRERVLREWSEELIALGSAAKKEDLVDCYAIREHGVPFASIREMSPERFVKTLKDRLGVTGVVAGENYRFGYRASGSAADLVSFGEKYGLRVKIVSLLDADKLGAEACDDDGCEGEQVSSSRVRACLKFGDVDAVTKLLGRKHRLCLEKIAKDERERETSLNECDENFFAYKSENITPKAGDYEGVLVISSPSSSSENNDDHAERVPVRCKIVSNKEDDDDDDEDDGYVLIPRSAFSLTSDSGDARRLALDIERRL